MPYCTLSDILEEMDQETLLSLTDPDGTTGEVDQNQVDSAITRAQGVIDGHIGARYTIPLADPVPNMIRIVATDLAIYALFTRKETLPKFREKRYRDAMGWLITIREGKGSLGDAGSGRIAPSFDAPEKDFPATVWEMF